MIMFAVLGTDKADSWLVLFVFGKGAVYQVGELEDFGGFVFENKGIKKMSTVCICARKPK